MSSYFVGLIIQSCIAIISVAAVFLMTSLAGMFSLGQAGYMAIGAYTAFILAARTGLPLMVTIVIGLAFCALVALAVAVPTVRLRKDYFTFITIGLGQAIGALLITFSGITNGALGFSKIPKVKPLLYITVGLTVLVVFIARNIKYSRFGRMCIALKTDELAAKSFGIKVYSLKTKIYILASVLGGIVGIIYGLKNRVLVPDAFGWNASSEMEIFLFFGGTNSLTGSVISAVLLKSLPEALRSVKLFGQSIQEYRTIIYCILIIAMINFRPSGLFGEYELGQRLRGGEERRK